MSSALFAPLRPLASPPRAAPVPVASRQPANKLENPELLQARWAWMMHFCAVNDLPFTQDWAWVQAGSAWEKAAAKYPNLVADRKSARF